MTKNNLVGIYVWLTTLSIFMVVFLYAAVKEEKWINERFDFLEASDRNDLDFRAQFSDYTEECIENVTTITYKPIDGCTYSCMCITGDGWYECADCDSNACATKVNETRCVKMGLVKRLE